MLADYGIAVALDALGTQSADEMGTPSSMAPEQFEQKVSPRSDQYALGCIAYELFTGQRPFRGDSAIALGWQHLTATPTPPHLLNPVVPIHIEQAILKALSKKREDRYPDVGAFLGALRHAAGAFPAAPTVVMSSLSSTQVQSSALPSASTDQQVTERRTRETLIAEGAKHHERGAYEAAFLAYQQAYALGPPDAEICYLIGATLAQMERDDGALAMLEQAFQQGVAHKHLFFLVGSVLHRLGNADESLAAYDQALRQDPDDAHVYIARGATLETIGRFSEALLSYEQAAHLAPTSLQALYCRGNLLSNLQRYEEALAVYQQAYPRDPHNISLALALAWIYTHLGHDEKAVAAYEQSILLDHSNAISWHHKGQVLEALGRIREAKRAYKRAQRLGYVGSLNEGISSFTGE